MWGIKGDTRVGLASGLARPTGLVLNPIVGPSMRMDIMEHRPGVKRPDVKPPVVNSSSGANEYLASYALAQQE